MLENKIRDFCEKQEVTIEQFERVLCVSPGYIYKLKGHTPGAKIAKKLAVILEISLEDVFEMCGGRANE